MEILLLIVLRFAPANGVWILLAGFMAIGFVGAIVFREQPVENQKALILSTGLVFGLFWLYIFGTLISATLKDPGIMPESLRQALHDDAAGNVFGAIPNVLFAMFTSWMICVMLAIVGNTFGVKFRRLAKL